MKYSFHITSKSWQTAKASQKLSDFFPLWLSLKSIKCWVHAHTENVLLFAALFFYFSSIKSNRNCNILSTSLSRIAKWVWVWFYWEINKYITELSSSRHHRQRHFLDCNINLCNQSYGVCTAYFMMPPWLKAGELVLGFFWDWVIEPSNFTIEIGFIVSGFKSVNYFETHRELLEQKAEVGFEEVDWSSWKLNEINYKEVFEALKAMEWNEKGIKGDENP